MRKPRMRREKRFAEWEIGSRISEAIICLDATGVPAGRFSANTSSIIREFELGWRLLICIIRKSSNLFLFVPTPLDIAVALSTWADTTERSQVRFQNDMYSTVKIYDECVRSVTHFYLSSVHLVRGEIQPVLLDFYATIWHTCRLLTETYKNYIIKIYR